MSTTRDEWVKVVKSPGGVGTAMRMDWLTEGCPMCGCKDWQVTSDGWAYCEGCHEGIPTESPWTLGGCTLSYLTPEGIYTFDQYLDLKKMREEGGGGICSICGDTFEGFGNNADPINNGRCCDDCNVNHVVAVRFKIMKVRDAMRKKEEEDK